MPEDILKKFAVTYEIDYVHRVVIGVVARDAESAQQLAEAAFNDGTIWDDTKSMLLLFDDYEEIEGETLRFSAEEVPEFPEPDSSVIALKQQESAFRACRMLLNGKTNFARNLAKKALPISTGLDSYQELNHRLDQSYLIELLGQEPDLNQSFIDNPNLKWADIKELVETQATMAFKLGRPISENEFELGSWQRKWFMDKYQSIQPYKAGDYPSKTELLTSSEILELAKNHNLKFALLQDGDFRGTHYLHFGYDHIYFYKDCDRDREVTEIRDEDFLYIHPDSLGKVWRVDQPIDDKISMISRLWKLRDALEQVRAALPDISFAKQEGVDPELVMRINNVLSSPDNPNELKSMLILAREGLSNAWVNHGGVSGDLIKLIDSVTKDLF